MSSASRKRSQSPDVAAVPVVAVNEGVDVSQLELDGRAHLVLVDDAAELLDDPEPAFDPSLVVPAWIVRDATWRIIVLSKDQGVVSDLEALPGLAMRLEKEPVVSINGYFIHVRQASTYAQNRSLFDCIVVKSPKKS